MLSGLSPEAADSLSRAGIAASRAEDIEGLKQMLAIYDDVLATASNADVALSGMVANLNGYTGRFEKWRSGRSQGLNGFFLMRSLAGSCSPFFEARKTSLMGELGFQRKGDIIIAPVIVGSKRSGVLQTVIGPVLIAASFFTFWAPPVSACLFASSVGMVAGGVIQMLSPQAGWLKNSAAPENAPGYAFGSAKNTTASGNPVPLCYGKRRVGGAIINAGIYAEDRS